VAAAFVALSSARAEVQLRMVTITGWECAGAKGMRVSTISLR